MIDLIFAKIWVHGWDIKPDRISNMIWVCARMGTVLFKKQGADNQQHMDIHVRYLCIYIYMSIYLSIDRSIHPSIYPNNYMVSGLLEGLLLSRWIVP